MPANDAFASPTVLTGTSGTVGWDNTGATYETGEPANAAGADGLASIWFEWTLGASAYGQGWDVTVDTSGTTPTTADTTLEAFTGSTLGALTLLDYNDDIDYPSNVQSSLPMDAVPDGTVLRIRVDSWVTFGSTGPTATGVLHYTATPTLPPPPFLTILSADRVKVGNPVIIHGTALDTVLAVYFGATPAVTYTIDSPTQITATVPTNATPSGSITVSNGSTSNALDFMPLFPGPWLQQTIYGPTVSLPSGAWRRSNLSWSATTDSEFLTGPDASVPTTPAVGTGTAQHSYDPANEPPSMVQGTGLLDIEAFWTDPTTGPGNALQRAMPPHPNITDDLPPNAHDYEYEDDTATVGTFQDSYRLHIWGEISSNTSALALQLRRIAAGDYNETPAFEDPALSTSWYFPADLAALDLIGDFTDDVPGQRDEFTLDAPADISLDDDYRLAFVVAVPEYVAGSLPSSNALLGVYWILPSFLYKPDRYRYLFDIPQAVGTGWVVGHIAMA